MKKDVIMTISGLYQTEDNDDSLVLTTRAEYVFRGAKQTLRYQESEITGYAGCETTIEADGSRQVTITRRGREGATCLCLENGRRHQCLYETPFGALNLGVYTDRIDSSLGEYGGELIFHYLLDVNGTSTTENNVRVSVKEYQANE